jgi:predicted permease
MVTALHDLRVAARSLIARPGFSVVAGLTLALGIGATTALFSVVHAVLLRALPYHEPNRIIALWQTARNDPRSSAGGSVAHVNFLDWKRDARSFAPMAAYAPATLTVTGLGEAEIVPGAIVTPGFFEVFGAVPVVGREFTAEEDQPNGPSVVVVSHAFWNDRLAGRADVIGSTIEVNGRSRQIVGVAPARFAYPNDARIWQPVANDDAACGRDCVYLNGIARLAPGATIDSARAEMQAIARRLEDRFPDANTNVTVGLSSLHARLVGDVQRALWVLLGAVTMVLLIACANVANLVLVRGTSRYGELAVRAALGASRGRMVRFLLTESLLLAAAGASAGLLMAWWGVDALTRLAPAGLPRLDQVRFDATTFGFAVAAAAGTTILFGLGPAISLVRAPVASLLGGRGSAGPRASHRGRAALLVVEVALAFILLAGAGLLVRSMVRLQAIDPGWRSEGVTIFTIGLPAARYPDPSEVVRAFEQIDERLGALPGIAGVARINGLPLGPSENVFSFRRTDRPAPAPGQEPTALFRIVDPEYLPAAGIPFLAGRNFDIRDRQGAPPVAIVSRELADWIWGGEDPVGRTVQLSGAIRTIVGVVGGVRSSNIQAPPQPEMYVPHAQVPARSVTFFVRSGLPAAQVLAAGREVVRGFDSRLPLVRPGSLAELERHALAVPRFNLVLLSLFAVLAVALAAVGVYGVAAYAVTQRTKEIGVRMALGAEAAEVRRLVIAQGLRPSAIGILLGAAGAFAAGRILSRLLYETPPSDPITLGSAGILLSAVVIAASGIPARRATRIPPAAALRTE